MSGENFRRLRDAKRNPQRKGVSRQRKPRILILTEGEKTEPLYLKAFCKFFGIGTMEFRDVSASSEKKESGVCIEGKKVGSAPISIANVAEEATKKNESVSEQSKKPKGRKRVPYWDKIFCVFDRDTHPTFDVAIEKIKALNVKHEDIEIKAIVSDICFELWFLIHYVYSAKNHTCADNLIKCLRDVKDSNQKKIFEYYEKNNSNYFHLTRVLIPDAVKNACLLKAERERFGTTPYTDMHLLIYELLAHAPQSSSEAIELKDTIAKIMNISSNILVD